MLSSGSISHLRAHARFRMRQRRAHRPGLHAEMSRDLPVIETEIELRDHHRALALCQSPEETADFHPIERRLDLVLRYVRPGAIEAEERTPEAAPAGADRDDEEPAGEVNLRGGRLMKPGDERVLKSVQGAIRISQDREQGAIDTRELLPIEQFPALGRDR